MTLAEFMKANSLTDVLLAEQLNCSAGAVRKWLYGERIPRAEQMRKIVELTAGSVTPNDFLIASPPEGEAA